MESKTLIMLKPNIVAENNVLPIIISLLAGNKVNIDEIEVIKFSKDQAKIFYNQAHENRIKSATEKLEKGEFSEKEFEDKKDSFDEIDNRNANFISSGNCVKILLSPKDEISQEEFIKNIRGLVEDNLRQKWKSNHDVYTFACNGVHASDSINAFNNEVEMLDKFSIENGALSKIYPVSAYKIDSSKKYNLKEYDNEYIKLLFNDLNKNLQENTNNIENNPTGKAFLAIVNNGLLKLLNDTMQNENMSNSLLLKHSLNFILNQNNDENYSLINIDQKNIIDNLKNGFNEILNENLELKTIFQKIDSCITNNIDITIGNKREFYNQAPNNKNKESIHISM